MTEKTNIILENKVQTDVSGEKIKNMQNSPNTQNSTNSPNPL